MNERELITARLSAPTFNETVRPRTEDDLTPAELAAAAIDMDRVLEREPQLGDFGFGVWDSRRKTRAERTAELRRDRESMLEPRSLAEFTAAREWLRRFKKIKNLNRGGTSYGLKHVAEDEIGYSANGCFIAAAIAEGFAVRRTDYDSPNAWFNISRFSAWRRYQVRRDISSLSQGFLASMVLARSSIRGRPFFGAQLIGL